MRSRRYAAAWKQPTMKVQKVGKGASRRIYLGPVITVCLVVADLLPAITSRRRRWGGLPHLYAGRVVAVWATGTLDYVDNGP